MNIHAGSTVAILEIVVLGAMFLFLPRVSRRGLLFGAYIGTETGTGDAARAITRAWYRGTAGTIGLSLLVVSLGVGGPLTARVLAHLVLWAGFILFYLRAYGFARELLSVESTMAVAPLGPREAPIVMPIVTAGICTIAGVLCIGYAWRSYPHLPEMFTTHFGAGGEANAWRVRQPTSWRAKACASNAHVAPRRHPS